jgi:pycsar effector protein
MTNTPASLESERLALDLLERSRAEVLHADSKAAVLLAGVLAAAGGVAAAIGAGKWTPAQQPWPVAVLFWTAAATTLAAITFLAAAIYPRRRVAAAQNNVIGHFGDVTALGSVDRLRDRLSVPGAKVLDVWIDQIWQISLIAERKHNCVRTSIKLLGLSTVLASVVVIVA